MIKSIWTKNPKNINFAQFICNIPSNIEKNNYSKIEEIQRTINFLFVSAMFLWRTEVLTRVHTRTSAVIKSLRGGNTLAKIRYIFYIHIVLLQIYSIWNYANTYTHTHTCARVYVISGYWSQHLVCFSLEPGLLAYRRPKNLKKTISSN